MKKFEDVMYDIRNMGDAERWKLVNELRVFLKDPSQEQSTIIVELIEEVSILKRIQNFWLVK